MVGQTPTDTPFGLQPNVAAGLAYLFGLIGGIIMLVGGGTNKFVKWAACQSIMLSIVYIAAIVIIDVLVAVVHLYVLGLVGMIVGLLVLVAYIYCLVFAFQGKEARLPLIADWTQQIFGSQLA
jgi:uncharacterized membrane protein